MKDKNLSKSLFKGRSTTARNVIGTIPNDAVNFSKLVAKSNADSASRTNFATYQQYTANFELSETPTPVALSNVQYHFIIDFTGEQTEGNKAAFLLPIASDGMIITVINKLGAIISLVPQEGNTIEFESFLLSGEQTVNFIVVGNEWKVISYASSI